MSPLFWILAAAMIAAVLASVLRPLLARPGPRADDSIPATAAVRARLAELDADAAAGAIAGSDAVAVRAELERELLQISAVPPAGDGDQWPARRAAFVIGILLPLFAIALYLLIGGQRPGPALSPEQMVEQLAARLAVEPDDPRGWDMLARSYLVLGRHRDARMALLRLQALSGDSPDLLVRLADAESREAGGSLAGHPAELVAQALALDPKNRAGLWLAGMIAAENGDKFGALARWKELLTLVEPSDPAYPKLEELIRRAEAEPEK